ncbi:MAG: hypothetical protein AB8B63_24425 [Granulosicoccus sp.]
MQELIDVLVETQKAKSLEVAKKLQLLGADVDTYDLVIRNANLSIDDAEKIADAIYRVSQKNGPDLHTISMSFNQNLKDEGFLAILDKIPNTTTVIAFVECGITDIAGQAIIDWASENVGLTGIYIEGNAFSKSMEAKFGKLRVENPQLTVLSEWASEEFKAMVKRTFD